MSRMKRDETLKKLTWRSGDIAEKYEEASQLCYYLKYNNGCGWCLINRLFELDLDDEFLKGLRELEELREFYPLNRECTGKNCPDY
jgi:hypothetical protein